MQLHLIAFLSSREKVSCTATSIECPDSSPAAPSASMGPPTKRPLTTMTTSKHTFLLVLLATCLAFHLPSLVSADPDRKVDCRRIVFHPYCRGISAKRGVQYAKLLHEDAKSEQDTNDVDQADPSSYEWQPKLAANGAAANPSRQPHARTYPGYPPMVPPGSHNQQFPVFESGPIRADAYYYPSSRHRPSSVYYPPSEWSSGFYQPSAVTRLLSLPPPPAPEQVLRPYARPFERPILFHPLHYQNTHSGASRKPRHHNRHHQRAMIPAPYDLDYSYPNRRFRNVYQ